MNEYKIDINADTYTDGNLKIVVYVRIILCYWICLRHLIRLIPWLLREAAKSFFLVARPLRGGGGRSWPLRIKNY